jgi:2-methylcitrate dehydratase PrpD
MPLVTVGASSVTSYTRVLAEFACSVTAGDLPDSARAATRRLILDTLGCAVGGSGMPSSRIVTELHAAAGGPPGATVLVSGDQPGLLGAVYVNAHAANALDAEETIRHSGHLAASTVPPALAVAERSGASGAQFAAAVTVGFDVGARIALSLRTLDTTPGGHTVISPVAGLSWAAFAATVAAGRLLELPPEAMAHAFGLTVACAPMPIAGRWAVQSAPRPMTKYGLYGAIARAGVEAALLARAGMDGDTEVLDGDRGFWRMNGSPGCDWDALTDGLGSRWLVEETSYKLFPACQWAMPALELIYRMAEQDGVLLADLDEVEVLVPQAALTKHMADRDVRTIIDGQFSIPHLIALAARGGPPGPRWHTPDALADPAIRAFRDRVRVGVYDQAAPVLASLMAGQGHAHLIPTQVTVRAGPRVITRTSNTCDADWSDHHAAQDDQALATKFRRFGEPYLPPQAVEAAMHRIAAIESAPDVHPLVAALVAD